MDAEPTFVIKLRIEAMDYNSMGLRKVLPL